MKKRKISREEMMLKQVEKIPMDQRPWEVLKHGVSPDEAIKHGRNPSAGDTELIWDRRSFEADLVSWIKSKPVPEFLYSKK
jgi:hypothetical protein